MSKRIAVVIPPCFSSFQFYVFSRYIDSLLLQEGVFDVYTTIDQWHDLLINQPDLYGSRDRIFHRTLVTDDATYDGAAAAYKFAGYHEPKRFTEDWLVIKSSSFHALVYDEIYFFHTGSDSAFVTNYNFTLFLPLADLRGSHVRFFNSPKDVNLAFLMNSAASICVPDSVCVDHVVDFVGTPRNIIRKFGCAFDVDLSSAFGHAFIFSLNAFNVFLDLVKNNNMRFDFSDFFVGDGLFLMPAIDDAVGSIESLSIKKVLDTYSRVTEVQMVEQLGLVFFEMQDIKMDGLYKNCQIPVESFLQKIARYELE